MRTTLTLEPDLARGLEEMRKQRGLTLKQAANEILRKGLEAAKKANSKAEAFPHSNRGPWTFAYRGPR